MHKVDTLSSIFQYSKSCTTKFSQRTLKYRARAEGGAGGGGGGGGGGGALAPHFFTIKGKNNKNLIK